VSLRLSVVIVHNHPRAPLSRCLDALEQCRPGLALEVLVVDQICDAEALAPLRARFPWAEFLPAADRRGFTFGINRGFVRARADAVLMLSPDCKATPDALWRLLRALQIDPTLAAAAPALPDHLGYPARSCGRFPGLWTLLCEQLGLARSLPDSPLFGRYRYGGRGVETLDLVDWASGAALMVSRRVWLELGGLDEKVFLSLEEVDWCRRAALAGHRVRFVPAARVGLLGRDAARGTPSHAYLHQLRSWVYYFRKHRGRQAAWAARAILSTGVLLRWAELFLPRPRAGAVPAPERAARARTFAAGLGVVWAS